ncbi:MAG: TonB-dependent receptor [Deltaproteobacteria bacterium]|nr:TonB-dependent receptor [Deltaproteobacteria bacterium]
MPNQYHGNISRLMLRYRFITAEFFLTIVVSVFFYGQVQAQDADPEEETVPDGSLDDLQEPAEEIEPSSEMEQQPIAPPEPPPVEKKVEVKAAPIPPPVLASEDKKKGGEEEIVVTAQRYQQSLQDAPVAVTTFSSQTMDRRSIVNIEDTGKFSPNLELHSTTRPGGGSSAYAAYIRGIGNGDYQFPTDPGVGLYVDDVYMARTIGGLMSLDADIKRVEIIKGPQGTLFGRNTVGGAISIVTYEPATTLDPAVKVFTRFGTYGRKDFGAYVNGPIVYDKVGAKLSVASLHSDGYAERVLTGEKLNNEERFVSRAGLRFTLIDDLDIRFDGDYSKQDQKPPTGIFLAYIPGPPDGSTATRIDAYNRVVAPVYNPGLGLQDGDVYDGRWISPGPYKSYSLQKVYDRYEIGGGSATIRYEPIDEFNIKSISALRTMKADISVDGDQTPYSIQTSVTDFEQQQFSQELQFSGSLWDELLRYMVGFYFFQETGDDTYFTESFHGLYQYSEPLDPRNAADTSRYFKLTGTSLAAFTQETIRIIPGLHLTGGVRVNRDMKEFSYSNLFPETGEYRVNPTSDTGEWDSITPKAGIDWKPIEQLMVYAIYSWGFKSGGFGPSNADTMPSPEYDPERVTAYELGVKTEWLDRRLTANLAGFYNDYRDIQLTVQKLDEVTGANVRVTQNAGSSDIIGFEVELGAMPIDPIMLNVGVGYVDAKFADLTQGAIDTGMADGDRVPQIPEWSINGGAQYSLGIDSVGEFTARGDVTYKGEHDLTAADNSEPSDSEKGYVLFGARLSFIPQGLEELELSLNGVNLADTVYYVYHATLPPTGQEIALAGTPRLIYFMAKYDY